MSELLLLVACGRRWIGKYGRLVRECQVYGLFHVSSRHKVDETSSKLLCPVPVATSTISRQLTWWNSSRGFLPQPQECITAGVIPPVKVYGSRRAASIVLERETSATRAVGHRTDHTAQASLCLQRLLGIDAKEADLCVKDNQGFSITDPADIPYNYKACLNAGFSETAIKQNPEILSYPHTILEVKIQLVADMSIGSIDDGIPFFKLDVATLRLFSNTIKYETQENKGANKITCLAESLQCPKVVVCQILAKHHFMQTLPLPKLNHVLKLMLDAHVTKEDILSDVWAFRYTPSIISKRLKRVTEAGVYPVKLWMIRCPELALSRRIGKELRRRSVLGDKGTIVEYLSQRFQCDKETINAFIDKHPNIARVSGPKMKRVVDFLLQNGYMAEHMMRAPRVFFARLETMQERLIELCKYRHSPKGLSVLCKSKQQYNDFLKMIK